MIQSSRGLGWAFGFIRIGLVGAAGAIGAGAEGGFLGIIVGLFLAFLIWGAMFLIAVPFFAYALIEMMMRPLMRSQIAAEVEPHPSIPHAVQFTIKLRGLSAFGLVKDAVEGLTAPELPPGFDAPSIEVGSTTEAEALSARHRATGYIQSAERRFHVVFYGGAALAAVFTIILYLLLPSSPGYHGTSAANTSGGSGYSTPYGDDGSGTSSSDTPDESPNNDFESDDFTVSLPSDWSNVKADEDMGAYTEWLFEPSESGNRHLKINRTQGVSASPNESANDVRQEFNGASDFEELNFDDDGDSATWEFVNDGRHVIDKFFNACGDGYALMYSATPDEFDRAEWDRFADSFSATCDDSSESTGGESASDNLAANSNMTYSSSSKQGHMEKVIRQHWQARLDGEYSKAYNKYAGSLQQRAGNKSRWIENIRGDGLNSVSMVSVKSVGGGKMKVHLTTDSDKEGCKNWHFVYTMQKISGHWRMVDQVARREGC